MRRVAGSPLRLRLRRVPKELFPGASVRDETDWIFLRGGPSKGELSMGLQAWNTGLLATMLVLLVASGTQREKAVLDGAAPSGKAVQTLETELHAAPRDPRRVARLAQAYVDARAPGHALGLVEDCDAAGVKLDPRVQHVYARALLDQGRAADALAAERRVVARCAADEGACDTWLLASATRRADILRELVDLGVEDATLQPETLAIAYTNATREARLAIR